MIDNCTYCTAICANATIVSPRTSYRINTFITFHKETHRFKIKWASRKKESTVVRCALNNHARY